MSYAKSLFIITILLSFTIAISFTILAQFGLLEYETMQLVSETMQPYAKPTQKGVIITEQMADIVNCESNWNQYKLGDGGRAIGLAQFHEDTFLMFQKQSGIKGSIFDAYTQLKMLAWALEEKKEHHWTCKSNK